MTQTRPPTEFQALHDKVILITGGKRLSFSLHREPSHRPRLPGTSGIGRATVLHLLEYNPSHVIFCGRSRSAAEDILAVAEASASSTRLTYLPFDLGDLWSIKAAIDSLGTSFRLDILICNGGLIFAPASVTKDGYEIHMGTNHLGHALLIRLFLPALERSPDGRIIALTSLACGLAPTTGIAFDGLKTIQNDFWVMGRWIRYGQSKLANILYIHSLARHHPDILALAVHPGSVDTIAGLGFVDRVLLRLMVMLTGDKWSTPYEGTMNTLWAITAPRDEITNGSLLVPIGKPETPPHPLGQNEDLAENLWQWTEDELRPYLS
ncbi:hypothetical protein P7C73_g1096, partial [Tremellales sp. Uapishka_1]